MTTPRGFRVMYEKTGASRAGRVTLAAVAALYAASAGWLLLGGGLEVVGGWLGRTWKPGDFVRRVCIVTALAVYFIRGLLTLFVFLKRAVGAKYSPSHLGWCASNFWWRSAADATRPRAERRKSRAVCCSP